MKGFIKLVGSAITVIVAYKIADSIVTFAAENGAALIVKAKQQVGKVASAVNS